MHGTENPRGKLDRLVRALSGMTAHLGYGIAVNSDFNILSVYSLSDPGKKQVALLCADVGSEFKEAHTTGPDERARSLLDMYESCPSWSTYFYGSLDRLTLPGGSVEEIELKAAIGVKALFKHFGGMP